MTKSSTRISTSTINLSMSTIVIASTHLGKTIGMSLIAKVEILIKTSTIARTF
jgi:hypothetical protein